LLLWSARDGATKGLFRVRVKFAGARVALYGGVELLGIKGLEPGVKARQGGLRVRLQSAPQGCIIIRR
jgi:hypothetical protein